MHLTFDDGPSAHTPELLEVLREHRLTATFFLVGAHVDQLPQLARQVAADGHRLGNHSWDHPHLTQLTESQIVDQLSRTSDAIERATDARPGVFRPPYGDTDGRVERVAAGLGMRTQLWDVDPEDWSRPGIEAIAAALRAAPSGAVVLLHDGRGDRSQTVDALRLVLAS